MEKTKTKNRWEVRINYDLAHVFKEVRKEPGLSSKYVSTHNSRTIQRVERAFRGLSGGQG